MIRSRKGVVKMLIASVSVYVLSYTPAQIPLFYNLTSPTPFRASWTFLVLVTTLAYANSAANPIIYAVFSHNFRHLFHRLLCAACRRRQLDAVDVVTAVGDRRQLRRHTRTSSMSAAYRMKQCGGPPAINNLADDRLVQSEYIVRQPTQV